MGFPLESATAVSVLLGVFKLLMTFVSVGVVESAGRRPLLLWGVSGMVASLVTLSFCTTAGESAAVGSVSPSSSTLAATSSLSGPSLAHQRRDLPGGRPHSGPGSGLNAELRQQCGGRLRAALPPGFGGHVDHLSAVRGGRHDGPAQCLPHRARDQGEDPGRDRGHVLNGANAFTREN